MGPWKASVVLALVVGQSGASLGGCGHAAPGSSPAAVDAPEPVAATAPSPAPADPAALYASCRERVEGPEADGECATDADCAAAGCSREVCVSAATAAQIMTACDVEECFAVLSSCGCQAGRCQWLVAATPPSAPGEVQGLGAPVRVGEAH